MCGDYIRAYSIDGIFASVVFCMTSMFTGFGQSGFSMINDLSSAFLVRIPITYFVSKMAGATLFQIGLASPIASVFSVILCLLYLKFGRWKAGMSDVIARS